MVCLQYQVNENQKLTYLYRTILTVKQYDNTANTSYPIANCVWNVTGTLLGRS